MSDRSHNLAKILHGCRVKLPTVFCHLVLHNVILSGKNTIFRVKALITPHESRHTIICATYCLLPLECHQLFTLSGKTAISMVKPFITPYVNEENSYFLVRLYIRTYGSILSKVICMSQNKPRGVCLIGAILPLSILTWVSK